MCHCVNLHQNQEQQTVLAPPLQQAVMCSPSSGTSPGFESLMGIQALFAVGLQEMYNLLSLLRMYSISNAL